MLASGSELVFILMLLMIGLPIITIIVIACNHSALITRLDSLESALRGISKSDGGDSMPPTSEDDSEIA